MPKMVTFRTRVCRAFARLVLLPPRILPQVNVSGLDLAAESSRAEEAPESEKALGHSIA